MLLGMAVLLCTAAFCMRQVTTPVIGVARLLDGSLRVIYGLPDNVMIDPHSRGKFDAASFSDEAGLVAKDGSIQLVTTDFRTVAEYQTKEMNPLLNVDGSEQSAVAWLPASQSLLHWNGSAFVLKTVNGLDRGLEATSVRTSNSRTAELLLKDANGAVFHATISLQNGELLFLIVRPGLHAPAFWQGSTILFQDVDGLAAAQQDGSVQSLAANGTGFSFAHISSTWTVVASETPQRMWAVHVAAGAMHISEMPAIPAKAQEAGQ
jgi:hypothetical protein